MRMSTCGKLWLALTIVVPSFCWSMRFEDARHLLNRTGFGATPLEIAEFAKLSREEAVAKILATAQTEPTTMPPYWVDEPVGGLYTLRLLALQGQNGEDVRIEPPASINPTVCYSIRTFTLPSS